MESIAGYFAGVVLMAGPALAAAAGASHWTAIPAFAAVPYAVRAVLLAGSAPSRTT
ncbi:MAG: hypothetical protein GWN79_19845, partial [Actinobacteria bacterium]|nr:hypothetical protein [Actinomycetota bacterium]NIT97518.1 hypothetical protein [Actinomycetota bacterium]NIU21183.1 hypothetical protein [Actinomycetota bacterium]NIX52499.1 hypothetical protein [Actinomycetota bacterium]